MVLFDYKNLNIFAKHSYETWIGGIILAAVVFLVLIIRAFAIENRSRGFKRKLRYFGRVLFAVAIPLVILVGFSHVKNRHALINEACDRYTEMYNNGECKIISGKVSDFTPMTNSKAFTLDGVRFIIYSDKTVNDHRDPSEKAPVIYYFYTKSFSYTTSTTSSSGSINTNTHFVPEKCAILGDNQPLEIHYVEEFGQNRILFIKELSE